VLGHVDSKHGAPETELELEMTVEHRRKRATAIVRKLPFFDPPRKKA
jgi:glycine cleavage system aminomethyltransferase T